MIDTNNCGDPGIPLHATAVATQGGFNYSCNRNEYKLNGRGSFRQCFRGIWSSSAPSCKSNTKKEQNLISSAQF